MRTFEGPRQGARFFFCSARAPGHSFTLLFVWRWCMDSAPERRTAHRTKKTRPVRVFFFAPRAARAHSLTLLFVEMFYRLGPREKDSTPNKKKNTSGERFFFVPQAAGLTHSRFFLWKCFIGSAPERRTAHRTKQKTRPVRVFFFAPRAARAHSVLTLLFVEMFYRLGPREKDSTPKKKKHVQCAFVFLLRARPELTHSLAPVVEYHKSWKQKTERVRNTKKQKMARIRSKKKMRVPITHIVSS